MNFLTHPAPRNRLGQLVARPGGITVSEALERAEAGLSEMAEPWAEALDEAIAKLGVACAALRERPRDASALTAAYALADEIVGLAGPAKLEAVGRAAYSLCDLLDRAQSGGAAPVDLRAVQVHLQALALLRRPASETGGESGRSAILDGLAQLAKAR